MDRIPVAPLKSSSFSAATGHLPRGEARPHPLPGPHQAHRAHQGGADEGESRRRQCRRGGGRRRAGGGRGAGPRRAVSGDRRVPCGPRDSDAAPPAVSEVTLDRFASAVEQDIAQSEGTDDKWAPNEAGDAPPLLVAIKRLAAPASALTAENAALGGGGAATTYTIGVHRVTGVLHRAMTFVEDEFHGTLEDPRVAKVAPPAAADTGSATGRSMKRPPSFRHGHGAELDRCVVPTPLARRSRRRPWRGCAPWRRPCSPPGTRRSARRCSWWRGGSRNALDASLQSLGYEKASIDDVVKMPLEALETEIATWIKAFQHTVEVDPPGERDLCALVFAGGRSLIGRDIFADLAHCAMLHLLNFAEAVVMTKRAAEKLFKVLDMYEAIRDAVSRVDAFLVVPDDDDGGEGGPASAADEDDCGSAASTALADLKHELASVRARLGESAAAIFCDLESSIRADAGKQPVPGGAVHPLTRYLMNYLKYACEYKKTLEQVFQEYRRPDDDAEEHEGGAGGPGGGGPFAAQLMEVMELLHGNLEAKSRLCKDPSLSSIC